MTRWAYVVLVVAAVCCGPVNNPVSPEYPCGTRGHMCYSGKCCWNGQECGGDVAYCPEDMCCYVGDEYAATSDRDAGNQTLQWRP